MGTLKGEFLLRGVHPQLVFLAKSWTVQLSFNIDIRSGVRTNAEQVVLFAKGRTTLGEPCGDPEFPHCPRHPLGIVVTQAKTAALSPHGRRFFNGTPWGCAFDAMPLDDAGRPQWYLDGPRRGQPTPEGLARLRMMAIYSERQGITWGGSWTTFPDLQHFQLNDWQRASPAPDAAPSPPADERVVASEADFSDVVGGSSTVPTASPPEDSSS